jgi:hypothetical protein
MLGATWVLSRRPLRQRRCCARRWRQQARALATAQWRCSAGCGAWQPAARAGGAPYGAQQYGGGAAAGGSYGAASYGAQHWPLPGARSPSSSPERTRQDAWAALRERQSGGGGGASLNGNNSGKGGDGAQGAVRVITVF